MSPVLFKTGPVEVSGDRPFLIAGPCVIEPGDHARRMAGLAAAAAEREGIQIFFKASFEKANRTSGDSYRGPGLEEGLAILARIKAETGLPILTDIHEPEQAAPAAEVADILQIPAFLCRQTALLEAAGRTGRAVNIKKGQFLAPWDMAHALEKARRAGASAVLATERGTSFGYNNLVVDMRSLPEMAKLGVPVVYDATHSVQTPGGAGKSSGGRREFIEPLLRAAVAAGVDGVFLEFHDDPEKALSDGPNALPAGRLGAVVRMILALDEVRRRAGSEN